ncbi:DegT/DnrJ/EryC1/StrS family aminotransferase [Synechococcus elongatus]|uniref:DegT/DnrJ/EryC1/StrS family aminotransferase n=1 Tax=Synechococcus elongatus PCC 11801 TaxID=2219813 RepID=A0AAN1QM93_SYNEL|nr:DegT/DnrJ/EryC1/StrS family aminotransferase [Synechococcus elongatus]AZB71775.1 Cys/Met metabolism pyridoxal-phosphate-dependent enzyme [Synechococcus elongatus PCC 11801]
MCSSPELPVKSIPAFNLTEQYRRIGAELEAATAAVLASGGYIGGQTVAAFETAFAAAMGVTEAVSCNSGTDALHLALRALDIGPGDEVITSPFTFFASAEAISLVGATPILVDIEPEFFNLDCRQLEAAITPRTKAIIPVHLFGHPAEMSEIMAIAQAHNLRVIEDCAQATGATWQGQPVGSFGDCGCFSFYPTKNLGACGDGGLVTTNNPEVAERLRSLRQHGMRVRYYHDEIGLNSRLDALQAVILSIKLRYLDEWNQQRQAIAHRYSEAIAAIPGLVAPSVHPDADHVWHQYTVRVRSCGDRRRCVSNPCDRQGLCRDWLQQQLQAQGVGSMIYYPVPVHLQQAYSQLGYKAGDFPEAERAAQEVLSLPMFPELTEDDQAQVITALKDLAIAVSQ